MDTSAETGIEDWNEIDYMKVRGAVLNYLLTYLLTYLPTYLPT